MSTHLQSNKFIPFITIHFKNGISFHSRKCPVTRIELNSEIINETIDNQLENAFQLFREHQIKYNVNSIGFTYNKSFNEQYKILV